MGPNAAQLTTTHNHRKSMMETQPKRNVCRKCNSYQYDVTGSGNQLWMCHTWGQACKACGEQNNFEKVCQSKGDDKWGAIQSFKDKEATMNTLMAQLIFKPATDTYRPGNNKGHKEVEATVIPFFLCLDPREARNIPTTGYTRLRSYPDNGVTMSLGWPKHLWQNRLSEMNLVSPQKKSLCCRRYRLRV